MPPLLTTQTWVRTPLGGGPSHTRQQCAQHASAPACSRARILRAHPRSRTSPRASSDLAPSLSRQPLRPRGPCCALRARTCATLPVKRSGHAPLHAQRAPAWPRRAAAGAAKSWKDKAWKDRTTFRGQDDRKEDEDLRTRTAKAEDRTAVDAPAPAAKDEAAVGTTVADSMATAVASTVATVAATMSQPAVQGTGARVSSGLYDRANAQQACIGRHRAGKLVRAGIHLPFAATRSRRSCWSLEEVAASASAQLVDDVDVAMPAGGDAGGGQARSAERGGPPKPRAAGGARQGRAAHRRQSWRTSGP